MKSRPSVPTINSYTYKLLFGKHEGKTIEEVIETEPGYILWMHDEKRAVISEEILNMADEADLDKKLGDAIDGQDFGIDIWDYMAD